MNNLEALHAATLQLTIRQAEAVRSYLIGTMAVAMSEAEFQRVLVNAIVLAKSEY